MTNKQTAVEFLVEQLETIIFYSDEAKENIIEQAKAMEKEQMIEFADRYGFDVCHFDYDRAEEYYERAYKQQDNGMEINN
jgi:hypothetical protein